MKDTPPYLTDAQADATYNEACAWMFGTTEPMLTAQEQLMFETRVKATDKVGAAIAILPDAARPVSSHVGTHQPMDESRSVSRKTTEKLK
jgi:hypothetical protein